MRRVSLLFVLVLLSPAALVFPAALDARAKKPVAAPEDGPAYTSDRQLKFPARYREWIFLSSGVDMSYDPGPQPEGHTVFNNVFVNPSAYKAYLETGTWPDKTLLVLENRGGEGDHSINVKGKTQSTEVMGLEIHVKDAALPGGWGFYSFDNPVSAKLMERPKSCYTCHEEHAAVDTTFVQFYPTLIGVAQKKGTLSAAYLREIKAPAAK